jgi:hypothetical protein
MLGHPEANRPKLPQIAKEELMERGDVADRGPQQVEGTTDNPVTDPMTAA